MPGSFFSRSPSLEPTSHRTVERSRIVRFANDAASSPGKTIKARPQTPRSKETRRLVDTHSEEESSAVETPSRAKRRIDGLPGLRSPVHPKASPSRSDKTVSKGKQRETIVVAEEESNTSKPEETHGDGDSGNKVILPEVSFRTQVRNKERELHTAKQKEQEYHSESEGDDDERLRDKIKIRALEEEVKRLQEEVGGTRLLHNDFR